MGIEETCGAQVELIPLQDLTIKFKGGTLYYEGIRSYLW